MKYLLIVLSVFFCLSTGTASDITVPGYSEHTLKNGLSVFLLEDHTVPMTKIKIAFRSGAKAETEELNGLFHLFEHMLFKGNTLYPTSAELEAATKRMGVTDYNAVTSREYVQYFFTIPSMNLEKGIEFWAAAVMEPLFDAKELAMESRVVHNEIADGMSRPYYKLGKSIREVVFWKYPYRLDVGGDLDVIDTVTVKKMRFIQHKYYIPNNAALFVSGDIDPEKTMAMVRKYFGDWKKGPSTGLDNLPRHPRLTKNITSVVDSNPTNNIIDVEFIYRGPDLIDDEADFYKGYLWNQILNNPGCNFKTRLAKRIPELHGKDRNIGVSVSPGNYTGMVSFSFQIALKKGVRPERTIRKIKRILDSEIKRMTGVTYYKKELIDDAIRSEENTLMYETETSDDFINTFAYNWILVSGDFFFQWLTRIKKVDKKDMVGFVKKYVYKKPRFSSIWISKKNEKKYRLAKKFGGEK